MKDNLLIYVCATNGTAPEWIQILPLGKVELRDSRTPFEVTAADLDAIIAKFKADGIDLVVDYEHQSLGGGKAPAAGWIKELQARDDGLYARVQWTADAKSHIEAQEYRYYSPVLKLDPHTRRPLALMHAALTNTPAMTKLAPLLAAKYGEESEILVLADFSAAERKKAAAEGWALPDGSFPIKTAQDVANAVHDIGRANDPEAAKKHIMARAQALDCMDLLPADWPGSTKPKDGGKPMKKLVMKMLGLPEAEDKPDQEILALVDARLKLAGALPEIAQALGLKAEESNPAAIKGAILALKQGQAQLTTLTAEVTALKAEGAQTKAQAAVTEALDAKKITPAQTEWALAYAGRDLEGFKAFVKTAAPVLDTALLKVPTKDGKGEVALTADELAMCKATGVTAEAFKASKESLAAGQA